MRRSTVLSLSLPLVFPGQIIMTQSRNPYRRGRLSTVDLLVQTSLDQLLLMLQALINFEILT